LPRTTASAAKPASNQRIFSLAAALVAAAVVSSKPLLLNGILAFARKLIHGDSGAPIV
jgi:hypothetical protein